ncbi:Puromycin-sensitive aminopeptidase and related aminopeptidases [Plasmopara halstedii]|uniref:Puromycin-sensitive aminopeptidase and related aminopeptidases n=1 Tax=Plasmopara halstedii TaxID=4781 RepID=A0A0P1AVW4_PLAHL|nr:Puromycin-sensitive aminopeptidase and related aminopeptidases [Plasmopara halstedii]CEG44660.1 Puromycin-sensitive aminopeptidase and related aminopeptidases [Plasmopara halstedii]|eukprot:XP_024581029.1 Puromycin-sensitive aminopeptidase and related aminopeptidases [Plasmopara halstedii]
MKQFLYAGRKSRATCALHSRNFCARDGSFGWHSDASKEQSDPDGGEFRITVIYRLGLANNLDVIKEARKRFHAYTGGDLSALSADLRSSVFDIKETFGEAGNAKLLHDLYNKSDFAGKGSDCLGAMGLVSRLSAIGLGRRKLLTRQVGLFVEQVLGDDIGLHVCGVISEFQSESMAVEVEAFMVGNNTLRYKRRLEEALEGMRSKVLFAVATVNLWPCG